MATGADTKVENGSASANAVAYTAYPPPPASREKPTAGADGLPPAQAEMHKKVLEHFRNESYRLPGVKEDGELRDEEKFWLSNDSMLRYLRATKWASAKVAIERLEGTLKWRREYGVYELTAELVEPEVSESRLAVFVFVFNFLRSNSRFHFALFTPCRLPCFLSGIMCGYAGCHGKASRFWL